MVSKPPPHEVAIGSLTPAPKYSGHVAGGHTTRRMETREPFEVAVDINWNVTQVYAALAGFHGFCHGSRRAVRGRLRPH